MVVAEVPQYLRTYWISVMYTAKVLAAEGEFRVSSLNKDERATRFFEERHLTKDFQILTHLPKQHLCHAIVLLSHS